MLEGVLIREFMGGEREGRGDDGASLLLSPLVRNR